jgi:S1-C subfamily serine protease
VLLVALAAFFVFFSRAQWAPPPKVALAPPPSPQMGPDDLAVATRGLMPLGITGIVPPLLEDRRRGVRVAFVIPGSPADRAGLQPGDLVLGFDDVQTVHVYILASALAETTPDRSTSILIERAGEEQTLVVSGVTPLTPEQQAF